MMGLLPAPPVIACVLDSCTLYWPCRPAGYGDCCIGKADLWGYEAAPLEDLLSSVTSSMLTAGQPHTI